MYPEFHVQENAMWEEHVWCNRDIQCSAVQSFWGARLSWLGRVSGVAEKSLWSLYFWLRAGWGSGNWGFLWLKHSQLLERWAVLLYRLPSPNLSRRPLGSLRGLLSEKWCDQNFSFYKMTSYIKINGLSFHVWSFGLEFPDYKKESPCNTAPLQHGPGLFWAKFPTCLNSVELTPVLSNKEFAMS